MSTDKILVIILGLLGIAFVYWFFLGKKGTKATDADPHHTMV